MTNTLRWYQQGVSFEDGSKLEDWVSIFKSDEWHWQYDTHELSYEIYEHDGQFWKLYRARSVPRGGSSYQYHFGGQACRMAKVRYRETCCSPHSNRLMQKGDEEWVRTYEVDEQLHEVLRAGQASEKYGEPWGPKH